MSVLRLKEDFTDIVLQEIMEYKMTKGWEKHGDPTETDFTDIFMRFLRYHGEFLVAVHIHDYIGQMEALADIANGCELLFPHIQDAYIQYREKEKELRTIPRELTDIEKEAERAKILRQDDPTDEQSRFME